jgi:Glycosyltransferase family 20
MQRRAPAGLKLLSRPLTGYLRVNDHFARELHEVLRPADFIWAHDYHLMPLAKALRERGHKNRIGFFLHIPCPPPEILTALPRHERLIPSLCEYDLVGFQTGDERIPSLKASTKIAKELAPPLAKNPTPGNRCCARAASDQAAAAPPSSMMNSRRNSWPRTTLLKV